MTRASHPSPTELHTPTGALPPQEAVIFDMDSVVTDTAAVHGDAWKQLFDAVLADDRAAGSGPQAPFDLGSDYRRYVDGRAREDGVAAFLAARGLDLPVGSRSDPAGSWTVNGLAARKNAIYLDLLTEHGVRVFAGTVDLLRRLRASGVPVALVTASRNAEAMLASADLVGVFDVVVDGERAAELGLPGKPDPAMFLQAALELGVGPARAAVVEDATSGVTAARRGGFGLVVGVDRSGQRDDLETAGADIVVTDVSQLDLGSLRTDPWVRVYAGFDPAHEGHREALTVLGNGYLGTRGAAPESAADGVHYPGTYLAGVYNRLTSTVHGRQIEDEHLVNAPNWLRLDLRTGAGPWWSAGGLTVTGERRELDMRRGVLGLAGAMFPWQSGSDGREETPPELYNRRSGRWMPDNSWRQRHVGLAVAFNAWQYYQGTGDVAWLAHRGADLIIEVARFFAALATYDPQEDRFHIDAVMGPDEYHDGYPDAPGQGLRDNAYTNVLAAWICQRATDVLAVVAGHDCDDVNTRLSIRPEEPAKWLHLSRRLAVPMHSDGVISQFEGYEALAELDWARYRATYGNIGRLDLILEAEGDSTNRYKLAKQADVLMLVYLLGPDGLLQVLQRLGYPTTPDALTRAVDYYLTRTADGSTLSRVVHASVLARMDPTRAWRIFRDSLADDLDDTQGGTTSEGIHLGAMAGTIDIITRSFAGLRTQDDTLTFDPQLPHGLRRAQFQVAHRGQRVDVSIDHQALRLTVHPCTANPRVRVMVAGAAAILTGGQTCDFPAVPDASARPAQDIASGDQGGDVHAHNPTFDANPVAGKGRP